MVRLAVVGILSEEVATPNDNFTKIIANLPDKVGDSKRSSDINLDLHVHLPDHRSAYHYIGSLTTPPCSENVQWLVLGEPVGLSKDQIEAITSRIGPNNRPVQALNDRVVNREELGVNQKSD